MYRLSLRLIGPVELIGPNGQNLTPRGMKARGALAIMGTSRGMKIIRPRLQDLLYSDRGEEQGAASIRQILREIRQAMGEYRAAVITGPGWVGLDKNAVAVELAARLGPDGQPLEFASDLDIADLEFESWIRDARTHHAENAPNQGKLEESNLPRLIIQMPQASDAQSSVLAAMILHESVSRAADIMPIDVVNGDPGLNRIADGIEIGALATRADNSVQLMFSARQRSTGRMVWTRRFGLPDGDMTRMIRTVAGNLTIAILHGLQHTDGYSRGGMPRLPIEDVFSYTADRLVRAETYLASLETGQNEAVGLSLRAYIRNTLLLERLSKEPDVDAEVADDLTSRAREMAPGNATVLAVSSLIAAWKGQVDTAFQMARQSQAIDSENPLARLAYSTALTGIGRHKEADAEASMVEDSALSTLGPAAWLLRRAIASLRMGDLANAERHFGATHGFASENRPALRMLSAVKFERGDIEGARKTLLALKKIEPDFTLDLMASDEYPVASLRSLGLLNITRSGLI